MPNKPPKTRNGSRDNQKEAKGGGGEAKEGFKLSDLRRLLSEKVDPLAASINKNENKIDKITEQNDRWEKNLKSISDKNKDDIDELNKKVADIQAPTLETIGDLIENNTEIKDKVSGITANITKEALKMIEDKYEATLSSVEKELKHYKMLNSQNTQYSGYTKALRTNTENVLHKNSLGKRSVSIKDKEAAFDKRKVYEYIRKVTSDLKLNYSLRFTDKNKFEIYLFYPN